MKDTPAIIFDLGNVLINLKDEATWWEEDVFPYFDAAVIEQLMNKGFFHDYESGKISDDDFRLEIHMARKYDSGPEVVDNAWNAMLMDIPESRMALLEELSLQHDLYLLSNTNNIHVAFIRQLSRSTFGYDLFEQHFQKCFMSQELFCRKPEEDIYIKVWNTAGLNPKNSIYLDDKPENLVVPERLGVTCLLVQPELDFEDQLRELLNNL